jgi:Fur family ferric uptake transcriptional regulator
LATVYRTIKLFEEHNVLNRIELGGKRARYEELNEDDHHDHLIDIDSGEIIEFVNEEIENLQMKVAKKLGYKLVDHRMELFGKKISK